MKKTFLLILVILCLSLFGCSDDYFIFGNNNKYSGLFDFPTYTNHNNGSITVPSTNVSLYQNTDFSNNPITYELAGQIFTLYDHQTNYIIADYNSGNPIMRLTTDVNEITLSNTIPIYTIVRTGNVLHTLDWDELAKGLAEKLLFRLVKTERFTRESGLALSEYGTRNLRLTSGVMWYGATQKVLDQVNSSTDGLIQVYHVAGNWESNFTATQYNNQYYDNGTSLVNLTVNRYAVNWIYRGVEDQKHLYVTYGTGDYTLNQVLEAQPPSPPQIISSHAVLVGKVIVQKGSSTAYSIQSAFDYTFTTSGVTNHNDLSGLQGGSAGEYYHINQTEYTNTVNQIIPQKIGTCNPSCGQFCKNATATYYNASSC